MNIQSFVRGVIRLNQRISERFQHSFPHASISPFNTYELIIRDAVHAVHDGGVIVDIGGGTSCVFEAYMNTDACFIALDISRDELKDNPSRNRIVADASGILPFADSSIRVITSRTVLEHVPDVASFVKESHRVLSPGGMSVHLIPCRYALFAVIARILPFQFSTKLLHFFRPQSIGIVGFPVYYQDCYDSRLAMLHNQCGFSDYRSVATYFQSDYYDACFPAFAVSVMYEAVVAKLARRNLAAYLVVVATK